MSHVFVVTDPATMAHPLTRCSILTPYAEPLIILSEIMTGALISTWLSNHIVSKVWHEITDPFPNFNGCSIEVWEWISKFISHLITDHVLQSYLEIPKVSVHYQSHPAYQFYNTPSQNDRLGRTHVTLTWRMSRMGGVYHHKPSSLRDKPQ